jgi:hypothetical protein
LYHFRVSSTFSVNNWITLREYRMWWRGQWIYKRVEEILSDFTGRWKLQAFTLAFSRKCWNTCKKRIWFAKQCDPPWIAAGGQGHDRKNCAKSCFQGHSEFLHPFDRDCHLLYRVSYHSERNQIINCLRGSLTVLFRYMHVFPASTYMIYGNTANASMAWLR